MSDDLAEAVERLKDMAYEDIAWDQLDNSGAVFTTDAIHKRAARLRRDDLVILGQHYLSTITAPTPVTVEGLKKLGFKKCSHQDFKCALSHPSGLIWDGRKKHVSARMWMTIQRPDPEDNFLDYATPQPETIEDVQYLLTRLSRPKPQ